MANANDFLLNTDYELDKIILFKQGNFTSTEEITHGLSFTPLVFGVWSTDEDFSSVNPIGWVDSTWLPGYTPLLSIECYATSSKINLKTYGNTNNANIYYRLYAFEPSDSYNHAPATSKKASKFILNTDYNYLKLYKTGIFTESNEEYAHNLGYVPQVMAWEEDDLYGELRVYPMQAASDATDLLVSVTDTKIKTNTLLSPVITDKIHWRIYYDKA